MSTSWHFPVFMLASFGAFIGILRVSLNQRSERPAAATALWVATVVVILGMVFAQIGGSTELPCGCTTGVDGARV